ncbi:glycosyltransferase [Chryseobacterium sp. CT-SW4]|uniref:glycosyltransferase n=1 Tax=Chryseobacterium sp. SW-1 TaxID=3157343 RepID=UPI003B0140BE
MNEFIHIITTRFNVPTQGWDITREGSKPLTDEWLADRFELFQTYTLPSFKNQTNKNFIWLVFFDINTSEHYKEIINRISSEFAPFTPVFVRDFDEMNSRLLEIIPTYFTAHTKYIISSDLDNDDILYKDFVKAVHDHFKPVHDMVIEPRKGLQLTKISDKEAIVTEYYALANPFVSLVESIDDFGTVIKENHNNYRYYKEVNHYDHQEMFIQIIHKHNLMNSTFNNKCVFDINLSDFGISPENHLKINKFKSLQHNMQRVPMLVKNVIRKQFKR